MTITIERPRDIDLEEFFELKVWVAPSFHGSEVMPKKQIVIGQTEIKWVSELDHLITNGVLVFIKDKTIHVHLDCGYLVLGKGDILNVWLRWDTGDFE